jgi:hypothetical protein
MTLESSRGSPSHQFSPFLTLTFYPVSTDWYQT